MSYSYTLDNLQKAEEALDRGDFAEAKKYIKYLRQGMERLFWERTHLTELAKGENHVDNGSTESKS